MMQMMSESVQASVRPHECEDTYYADEKNSKVQCFPAVVENRFVVGLPSLTQGSTSTVTFNPDGLVTDVILTAQIALPGSTGAAGDTAGSGLGMTRGWLYQLVDSISVRYAGSSLYYFQGEQELIACLSDCEDSVKRDNLLALGGGEIMSPADWANPNLTTASIYIKLPHNSPSAQEKPMGFPTDAISAPLQIQIKFKQFNTAILANATTAGTLAQVQATIPTSFASAQVQFKQAHLQDRSDAISSRADLSKHALSVPLKYFQQSQFSTSLPAQASSQYQVNLTGFRSGSVQGIFVWAVQSANLAPSSAGVGSVPQPLKYLALPSVSLSVNGLVYYTSSGNSSQLINLVERKCASQASTTALTWVSAAAPNGQYYTATGASAYWVWIPFAQGVEVLRNNSELSNGLGIANSVVNLTVDTGLPNTAVTLYASYLYNATLLCSGGSADYVF
jgi:hypothetical protein